MRILLGLHDFSSFAGTETYTLTVAAELQRLGHDVVVYAETTGAIAGIARDQGISVTSRPEQLPASCDGVLAQDTVSAFSLAARYPDARRLMVVHSEYYALQSPPQLDGVCDAVVVLNDRVRRHVEHLGSAPAIIRLSQPVDLKRFGMRGGMPDEVRRVLVLGNYLRGVEAEAVTSACRAAGFEPVLAGIHTTPTSTPERAIADAEVVLGLGRCVIEAMASRRAAYVYGIAGSDGWVTAESYPALEANGFAGTATPTVVDTERLACDLAEWDPEMGIVNRHLANAHHDIARHAAALVTHLRDGASTATPALVGPAAELARLVRVEWQTWSRYVGVLEENRALREQLVQAAATREELEERLRDEAQQREDAALRWRADVDAVAAARDAAEQHHLAVAAALEQANRAAADAIECLEAFRATRRYRLARRIGAPLDALRRR